MQRFARLRLLRTTNQPTTSSLLLPSHSQTRLAHSREYQKYSYNNVPDQVLAKVGQNLHLQLDHPLNILKTKIEEYFKKSYPGSEGGRAGMFKTFDDLHPKVSTVKCFDELLTPKDHVSRRPTDTFYFDEKTVLRTHTSAHQTDLMRQGNYAFLVAGDCYRRDEIDYSHYPVFHQMEGVRLWEKTEKSIEEVRTELKVTLEGLSDHLFGQVEKRWVDAYFPFTDPSLELEIFFEGQWLEVLGCGVVHDTILTDFCKLPNKRGWAFGLGLERLAMVLFGIPDIRLFWSTDPRFTEQFKGGKIGKFKPFSKYPPVFKDISSWWPEEYHDNDFFQQIRDIAGDWVEKVELIDTFTHPKTNRTSKCFRITYRSMERTLLNSEVDEVNFRVRDALVQQGMELR
eukprot:gb/GEZN01006555.1/.p1 GENE.gb/GEZN01006555.1/~~gb/GEZN01006555.1/.p1  ORF type:complete len:398 (+),score=37.35 gb/GEZN01006555.1/:99-1292(+)